MAIKLDESFDFGFSLVTESELKSYSEAEQLKTEVSETTITAEYLQEKLFGLRDMIMPLLLNLKTEPNKEYILWHDREKKINVFINKINDYIEN